MNYHYHSMSLVERKKQQWAREREELASLGVPFREYSGGFEKSFDGFRHGSKPSVVQKEQTPDNHDQPPRERRSSLPPLSKNQYNSNYDYRNEKPDKPDRGGETSGYGSDCYPSPDYKDHCLPPASTKQSGYESSSSCRDDRPKWGDKGVGIGKFWQPREDSFEKLTNEPPNWVKRGLQVAGAIVVANSSPSVSPEQRYEENDRPCTGSSFSQHRSYIRGQNIPIDSLELAERERKRQLALAHQQAIRKQLEERESKRQEERAQKIREEREEELRIEREQEYERQRKLEEEKAFQEKMERETKRKEAIKEALELAEKEAKLEKMRLKMMKHCNNSHMDNNIAENVKETEKVPADLNEETQSQLNNSRELNLLQKSDNVTKEIHNNLSEQVNVSPTKSTASTVISHHNNERSLTPIMPSPRNRNIDQFTYFFQPTLDSLQNIQYAVLIPTTSPQYPVAIPVNIDTARTENRILTPTRYRNNAIKCDSSTQTDNVPFYSARSSSEISDGREKYLREKMSNLEIRRDRRSRSESMDERPKWGVNRPPTRYMKQSEKDPLYQRRKLRQKRDTSEKNSSDDSQTGTPIRYRKDKRHSRGRWRAEERIFDGNMKMYQREIVPLESDRDQLYLKCCCTCQRHKCSRVDILRIEEDSPPRTSEYDFNNKHKVDILNKLSSLHNGLLLEQEKWENSPRTPPV